jgi:hypothetical protein
MSQNCDDRTYQGVNLPLWDGDFIISKVDVPGINSLAGFITDLPQDVEKVARKLGKQYDVNRLIAFFKLQDGQSFPDNANLRLKYSPAAWDQGFDPEFGRPRVFYLMIENGQVVGNWVEFDVSLITYTGPSSEDPFGYICIELAGLPDPLIGGC